MAWWRSNSTTTTLEFGDLQRRTAPGNDGKGTRRKGDSANEFVWYPWIPWNIYHYLSYFIILFWIVKLPFDHLMVSPILRHPNRTEGGLLGRLGPACSQPRPALRGNPFVFEEPTQRRRKPLGLQRKPLCQSPTSPSDNQTWQWKLNYQWRIFRCPVWLPEGIKV